MDTRIYFLLFISLASQVYVKGADPSKVDLFKYAHGFYFYEKAYKNWYDAQALCYSNGLQLASIQTPEKLNDFIMVTVDVFGIPLKDKTDELWTSGSKEGQDNFIWTSTGEEITLNYWGPGEPSGVDTSGQIEECVTMRNYSGILYFSDAVCNNEYRVICEKSANFGIMNLP